MRLHFRLRWIPLIATIVVCAIGISLGNWQTRRAGEKQALQQEMVARASFDPLNANALTPRTVPEEFRRITADGEFLPEWAVYLDNRPLHGKSGFYLLMPLKLAGSDQSVLVLRGWFPRDVRDPNKLPVLPVPSSTVHLEGKVRHSAGKLMQLGEPVELRPGAIVQNAEVADFVRASKLPLHTFIIEQTSDTGDGLVRDWPLPSTGIDTHRGYAFQWYALSVAALIFFLVTGFQRASK
jgi:surfeit locus 1 family protein